MAEEFKMISSNRNIDLESAQSSIKEQMPEAGWGIFADHSGTSKIPRSELVDVKDTKKEADSRAADLNESDGYEEFEVDSDPESWITDALRYRTGKVTLTGLSVKVELTYEAAQDDTINPNPTEQ